MIALRDYQERAIDAVRVQYSNGVKRVLLVAPTGFGKTALASALIASALGKGHRVLFLVHRREIVLDTAERLRSLGLQVGVLMPGHPPPGDARVVVASVATVVAREARPEAELVIWDEAHHSSARSYESIRLQYPSAWHLGLTATPERGDGVGLSDAFDVLVVGATVAELQSAGWLAQCDVIGPPKPSRAASMTIAHALEVAQEMSGGSVLLFTRYVQHSRDAAREIEGAAHVDGSTSVQERAEAVEAFRGGAIRVLSSVGVFTEGTDLPRAKVCILARPVGSAGLYLQMVGRVLRPFEGQRALVIDLYGSTHLYGPPEEPREYTLHGIKRLDKKKRPWLCQCLKCGSVVLGARRCEACSLCGHPWPPVPALEVREQELGSVKRKAGQSRDSTLASLHAIAQARGYKPGWVAHQYKARFGVWPRSKGDK